MSQNITWLGASYSDVPAVTLPKTGSGTARFTDVTDTTAIASDVAAGKYFHLATGERVAGTASGGGGDTYTLTTIVPQQTVTPQELSGSYQTTVTYTAGLEDGEYYLVTYDGDEYVCTCGLYWGSDNIAGNDNLFFGNRDVNPYPFGIDYAPSTPEFAVATYDLNQHTIKVEHLEFVDGPLNLIAKSVTENGTYSASSDNADGYSSVTVNVPSGGSSTSLTYAGFYGVEGGRIYYTDENMQQQSGTSLAANLPSGSIVAVMTTNTGAGIRFALNQDDQMSISFGLTSVAKVTASRKTYAQVFVVN